MLSTKLGAAAEMLSHFYAEGTAVISYKREDSDFGWTSTCSYSAREPGFSVASLRFAESSTLPMHEVMQRVGIDVGPNPFGDLGRHPVYQLDLYAYKGDYAELPSFGCEVVVATFSTFALRRRAEHLPLRAVVTGLRGFVAVNVKTGAFRAGAHG